MYMNWPRGKILAWADDANGSSIGTSAVWRAAERRALADLELRAGREAHRRDDHEPRLDARAQVRARLAPPTCGGPRRRRLIGTSASAARQVAQRAAHDPEQEQVEHGQEAELGAALRSGRPRSPTPARSAGWTRPERDLVARVQLGLGRRAAVDLDAVGRAQVGDHPGVVPRGAARRGGARRSGRRADVAVAAAADQDARARRAPCACRRRPAARRGPARRSALELARPRSASRPSCGRSRPAGASLGRPRRPPRARCISIAWMPNSPTPQPVVGLEVDGRARDQREALVARVLEQVVGQLLARRRPRSPRTARGPAARGRPCTGSGT